MTTKKYFFVFAIALLTMSGLTVAFNRVVDPFWYFRDVSIEGLNAIKPKFRNYERYVKPLIVQREQPHALIFGSSYAEIGFDPLHPALTTVGKSYSFALAGAPWEMVACDVKFAFLKDANLHQIVLGIHLEDMPKINCNASIEKMGTPDLRAFLFSYDAFEASINTVLEQHKQKPSHTLEGLYFYTRGTPATESRFREYFAQHPSCKFESAALHPLAADRQAKDKELDLGGLQELVSEVIKRGIVLKLVVYPRHALLLEQEYQCGTRQARWNELNQVADLVKSTGSGLVEVWDFEGYHAIGTEPISEQSGYYWQDPRHFNFEMGNIMLDEMFGLNPAQLGMRINTENIDARADIERRHRLQYLTVHPEFLTHLTELLPNR